MISALSQQGLSSISAHLKGHFRSKYYQEESFINAYMNITFKNNLSIVSAGSQQYVSTPKMTFYDKTDNTNNITNKIYSLLHIIM